MRPAISLVPLLLAMALRPAVAGRAEEHLLSQLRKAHPATRFDRVVATPAAGLYEVWMGENVAYISRGNVRYLVFGHLFDAHRMRDLTAGRRAQQPANGRIQSPEASERVAAAALSAAPSSDAIVLVRGSGERKLLVFTDPACPYCRQLDTQLRALRDVTVLHYLLPYQGRALPEAIWCAADRDAAYARAMAEGGMPETTKQPCAAPLERNLALAARLGVRATPTLIFSDGRRVAGLPSNDDLETGLARAVAAQGKADGLARSGEYETTHEK
ncbi:DsbC family protein [Pseudoduganella namucuonensis]|uniref:Thiol:disulfide interchange protein n=1 Tax=Pseudoduganella namucuonensis TaxID=1035707 RepID=A0A1I7M452_9BURK|nr:DsbC family protein [Pseudoduganella namucuonensis]SFV16741.1 thiol:disulfide interchange protein DsbC [Pseudoduganella namucuonensis]